MEEYEYSFKVCDLTPYLNYCEEKGFILKENTSQIRVLYRNPNKTMARITTKIKNNKKKIFLDFKDDNQSDETLKLSRETIPLEITDKDFESINSILDMLNYSKDITLIRDRIVYEKDTVKLEIDNYSSPEIMYVVAVEGEKDKVDEVYNEIKRYK